MNRLFASLRILKPTKRQLFCILSACVLTFTQTGAAYGLTPEELVQSGIDWYSPNTCGTGTPADTALSGKDNEQKIFNYLVGKGLTGAQASGVLGNLRQEDGSLDPKDQEYSSDKGNPNPVPNHGFGIVQWTSVNRQQGLIDFAKKQNKPVTDFGVQLDFLWLELTTYEKSSLSALKESKDYVTATIAFQDKFERPGNPQTQNRLKYAKEVWDKYGRNVIGGVVAVPGSATNTNVDPQTCNTEGAAGTCPDAQATLTPGSPAPSTTTATAGMGNIAILCQARRFDKFGYLMGGGHEDPEAWMAAFTKKGGFNQPYQEGVSPPDLDCSGIEIVAIWLAFHVKTSFLANPPDMNSHPQWFRHIAMSQVRPGDLLVHGPVGEGHTEIATNNGGTKTFGAHTQGIAAEKQISDATGTKFTDAYVWIGPGSDRK
ncbi:MAG TPA: phage tail tip lysozyme [Candidatus Saccharimonadales bacterium]|jgi:hypothetical protein|nr:phage tail tip lysozyme [Candidatus Saccharimonadales bacterium]